MKFFLQLGQEMYPKGSWIEGVVSQQVVLFCKVLNIRGWTQLEDTGHCHFGGCILSPVFSRLPVPITGVASATSSQKHDILPNHSSKINRAEDSGPKPLEIRVENKQSLTISYSLCLCSHSYEELTIKVPHMNRNKGETTQHMWV